MCLILKNDCMQKVLWRVGGAKWIVCAYFDMQKLQKDGIAIEIELTLFWFIICKRFEVGC